MTELILLSRRERQESREESVPAVSVDPLDPLDPLDWLDLLVSLVARYEKTPQCIGCLPILSKCPCVVEEVFINPLSCAVLGSARKRGISWS